MVNNWKKKTGVTALAALMIVGGLLALPALGDESTHKDLTVVTIETAILNDNVAVKRAELDVQLKKDEEATAISQKDDIATTRVETDKNRLYYPKEKAMKLHISEVALQDTKQAEVLKGTELYYNYLLLVKEITNQNNTVVRLKEELAAINKRIELGTATVNERTTKELAIAKANYALDGLQDKKANLFLDLNLSLQQDLATVLVLEKVKIPFEALPEIDLASDLEYVLATNLKLWEMVKQDELDAILLDIYENNNSNNANSTNIVKMQSKLEQNKLNIANKKLGVEYDLRSKHNTLLNKYDAVEIKTLELDNANIALKTTTKRYEVGFETENTLKAAKEKVAAAEHALDKAKLDYYLALEGYRYYID